MVVSDLSSPTSQNTTAPAGQRASEAAISAGDRSAVLPVAVAGLGTELPERVVTNDDLTDTLDTSDEWIRTRTGIRQRHLVSGDQATSDLAIVAARTALSDAGCGVEDLAAILVATTTPDHTMPATAPLVAAGLGAEVAAFDLNAACTGFVYGLQVGGAFALSAGGPVLVVGAETLSRVVDWSDRSTAVLFGDGAGAAVLVADARAELGPFELGSDGTDPSMLWVEAGGTRRPAGKDAVEAREHFLSMRGGDVYRHAVTRMVASARSVLQAAELEVGAVDLLVGHQANARILTAVADRLGLPAERNHMTVDKHANTSAASIPLALADARDCGRLTGGELVLLTAFGSGLTWGSCLLRWREPDGGGEAARSSGATGEPGRG